MIANELAVKFTLQVAKRLLELPDSSKIRIVIIGGGWQTEQVELFPNLIYLGHVKDYMAYIDHADICLLPYPQVAVCGGARNKALDYFVREKIVLSTIEGMRGLTEFKPGEHAYYSTDDPVKFANDLLKIINNFDDYRYLGEKARRLVKTEYNWQKSAVKVLSTLKQITSDD
jgi:glycosyltransferase involved in cell wall biosynthesis